MRQSASPDRQVLTVADSLQEESFDNGKVVFEQGDVGEAFYIIKEVSFIL